MRLVSILFGVTVVAGIAVFVLSAHRPSIHAPVSQLPVSQPMVSQPPVSQPPVSQAKAEPSAGELGDSPNFAVAADRALSELREGITVTEWKAHHPGATKIDTASIGIGGECVILAEWATLADGAQIARVVSFNPPRAPSPAVLPTLQGESLINESCTMSKIEVEVKVADEAAGRAAQRTVNQQFDATYGPSEDQVGVWHSGSVEIINAYDSGHRLAFDTGKPKFGPAAYVWAYLPFWKQLMFPDSQNSDDPQADSVQFRRAVAIAGIDPVISGRMEKLYDLDTTVSQLQSKRFSEACAHDCTEAEIEKISSPAGDDWRKPLVPTLRDWLNAVKPLRPNRQAAGLIAADRLLTAFGSIAEGGLQMREGQFGLPDSSSPEKAELRSELEGLGAVIALNEDGRLSYNGNWLELARHLSPDTESGKLASFVRMTAAQCQEPEAVISVGEDLIARGIDAPTAALTHFMVGDSFSDMLLRAIGAQGRGKAEAARSKALQHYAAGLADDGNSREAKDAWLQAWHILAGLPPHARYGECGEGD
jgi:hypothetical protein